MGTEFLDSSSIKRMKGLSVVVLGAVPLLYVLGFLVWSVHSISHGLGMLPLTVAQYLAAGTVLFIYGAVALIAHYSLSKVMASKFSTTLAGFPKRRITFLRGLLLALSAAVAIASVNAISIGLNIFRYSPKELTALVISSSVGVFLVFLYAVWFFRWGDKSHAQDKPELAVSDDASRWSERRDNIASIVAVGVVFFFLFSLFMFSSMSNEFGGGEERIAKFDIDPADFSSNTLLGLWPDWNATEDFDSIVRTPEARVLYANENVLLVRSAGEDSRSGALFELSRSDVKAIIWL